MKEDLGQFEKRKQEHIALALEESTQGVSSSDWDQYQLQHEAFPEINFKEVDTSTSFFSSLNSSQKSSSTLKLSSPLFISSMTAGHEKGEIINTRLARLSEKNQILMGVGSQRKELQDSKAADEWKKIKKQFPKSLLMGNIGLTQVITSSTDVVQKLVDSLEAQAMIVHTNPMQEALQDEGTPDFRGGLKALENLCKKISVPVVVKEVGFGFTTQSLKALTETGIAAVDVSGKGGTHWGRIEGLRSQNKMRNEASLTFSQWGRTTLETLKDFSDTFASGTTSLNQVSLIKSPTKALPYEIWASGGIRNGLDAAKCLSLGAQLVGLAQPWLKAALVSDEELDQLYDRLQLELKIALFCTGSANMTDLRSRKVGLWQKA